MVVGLTVVAFGTSSPEMAATLAAALQGSLEVALGNVVGSNIANIGLILALAALIAPLRAQARFIRREIPFMIATGALLWALAADGRLSRPDGLLFLVLLAVYLRLLLQGGEVPEAEAEFEQEYGWERFSAAGCWLRVGLGLLLLSGGSRLLVAGAVELARRFGVGELVIGLTLVAVGTSLPELAASVVAAVKREPDIALGNVVGSNIFNVLGILGITVLAAPVAVPAAAVYRDLLAMLVFGLLLAPFLLTGMRLGRLEGAALLAFYLIYVWWRV
jgi:cation:H+ antiporter